MAAPDELIAGRYRLRSVLGSGGMGTVWEAWDERLERRVAVKQLRLSDPGADETELAAQRAMREARISARLHHPYAVAVFDAVEHEGQPCLVMQFVDSIALSALLRSGGPLQQREAAQVGAQVGSALAAAHAAGIVHRDVKPGNILIAEDGTALISDFGISHALGDATLTSTGLVHGTPAYLAPEVARGGEASYASDVFSLGSTLYAALEGSPPFGTDTNSIALLHRVAAGAYPPPEHSGPVGPLLEEMLSPDPDARPTMSQAAARLGDLASGAAASAAAPEPAPTASVPGPVGPTSSAPVASAPVAAAPVAAAPPPTTSAPAEPEPPTHRRRLAPIAAALAVLVALGLLVGGLLWADLPAGGNLAGGPASESARADPSATPTSSVAPSSAPRTVPASPPPASTQPSSARPPTPRTTSPTPTRSPTRTRSPALSDPPTAGQLAGAITDYYALMPGGTDQGWSRLTASYQRGQAVSRSYYESFWGQFRDVDVSNVSGQPPDRAVATITYRYADGRVDVERRTFGLVEQSGRLKINTSRRLSSNG